MTAATTKLIIEDDAGKTIVVPFAREEITIGRKEGNTIRLTERNVSRFHAKLLKAAPNFFIEDLGSYNGIKLNGDKIKGRVEIQEGDLIEIGDYHLALQTEGAAETLPARPANPAPASAAAGRQMASLDNGEDAFSGDTVRVDSMPDVTQEAMALPDPILANPDASTVEGAPIQPIGSGEPTRPAGPPAGAPSLLDEETEAMPLLDDTDVQDAMSPIASPPPVSMDDIEATIPHDSIKLASSDAPLGVAAKPKAQPIANALEPIEPPSSSASPGPLDETTQAITRAPGGAAQHTDRPRLVALNTVFAGMVWPIDRGDAVIGRTEDNDLTIQHKSVSRNHAKVVPDGDKFRIFDLQSANGVLVNGEEIESVPLRPGDVIELGRVRLRYVPAGEAFALSHEEIEQARLADTGDDFDERGSFVTASSHRMGGPRRPPLILGAMALVIILLLVVIVVLVAGGDDETPDPVPVPNTPTTPSENPIEAAKEAMAERDWVAALAAATQADEAGDEEAAPLLVTIKRELAAVKMLRKASRAEEAGDLKSAKAAYDAVLKDYAKTAGAEDATDLLMLVEERILLEQIEDAFKAKDADEAAKLIEEAQTRGVEEDLLDGLRERLASITKVAAVTPSPKPKPKPKPKVRVKPKSKRLNNAELGKLESKVQQVAFQNKHGSVIRIAQQIPRAQRSDKVVFALLRSSAELGRCASAKAYLSEYVNKAAKSQHKRARTLVRECK